MMKRAFDVAASALGLLLLSPFLAIVALLVKLTSRGPVFFTQERVGRGFRAFRILKFRTMVPDAPTLGPAITPEGDPRITRVGRFLRRSKVDELPQLWNVLKGEMSLVGPRPEVPKYVELFRPDFEEILKVRPGITDPSSLAFRDEGDLLWKAKDPERFYVETVLPRKLALSKAYARNRGWWSDLGVIFRTLIGAGPARDLEGPDGR